MQQYDKIKTINILAVATLKPERIKNNIKKPINIKNIETDCKIVEGKNFLLFIKIVLNN